MKFSSEVKSRFRLTSTSKIILIFTFLHFAVILLLDKVTAFAPDEANYISVFSDLYESDFSLDGYLGWQTGSINALRFMYLPAKILENFGFSTFFAVRILSCSYSVFSLYLLLRITSHEKILASSNRFWIIAAYFVPSIFLWTSLGLRESFIFFSFVAIFYILVNPLNLRFRRQFLLLAVASTFLLISKIYLFGLLLICLAISALFLSVFSPRFQIRNFRILSAMLVPLLVFPSITTNIAVGAKEVLETKLITPTAILVPTPTGLITSRGQTLYDLNQQLDSNPILAWILTATGIKRFLQDKAEASYMESDLQELSENAAQRQTQPGSLRDPLSLLVGAYNFLLVPTPFVDNGSFFLNVQSYESFLWYFYYLILIFLVIGLIRRRYLLNLVTLSTTLFSLSFIAMSALIEINSGTSVRHRAVLLIAILVMLATFQHKQPERLED